MAVARVGKPLRARTGRLYVERLESVPAVSALFDVIATEPGAFLLESGPPTHRFSRWSFLGARPRKVLSARGADITVTQGRRRSRSSASPFRALRAALGEGPLPVVPEEVRELGIPFLAGAVGFLGYDLCHFVERLPRTVPADIPLPDLYFAFYDAVLALDHQGEALYSVVRDREPGAHPSARARAYLRWLGDLVRRAQAAPRESPTPGAVLAGALQSNFTSAQYLRAVARTIDYIGAGDIFQVNLSQRFEGRLTASPADLYRRLHAANPAPFAAYLAGEDWAVVGSSPERFLRVRDGRVETCPIKGTRPRGADPATDSRLREELLASAKDNAELTMIVDLERNDLG
ncbi:MAG: anthranilate synthase component I family protein, partial [Planctomycetes bacterium]|nr:anthranilate synthase component I family protein [Planctomycetota bacterium]